MIPVKPIDPEDLPLYAMKLLPQEDLKELTSQLEHSSEGRRILAEIYGDLAVLAHSADMYEPPAAAQRRLMTQVAQEKKVLPADPLASYDPYVKPADEYAPRTAQPYLLDDPEPARRTIGEKFLPWTGWLIAAGVSAFAFNTLQQNGQLTQTIAKVRQRDAAALAAASEASQLMETMRDPGAVHATLTSAETRPLPSGRVTYVAEKGSLLFLASDLAPLDPYKTYELWVIPVEGQPIPAGTFKPDDHGSASVVLPELQKGIAAKAFGVTVEDAGGSLTPTAPVILKGAAG